MFGAEYPSKARPCKVLPRSLKDSESPRPVRFNLLTSRIPRGAAWICAPVGLVVLASLCTSNPPP